MPFKNEFSMLHTTMATTATSRDTYSLIRLVGSVFFFAPLQSVRHFVRVYTNVCVCVSVHLKAVLPWKTVYLMPFEKR